MKDNSITGPDHFPEPNILNLEEEGKIFGLLLHFFVITVKIYSLEKIQRLIIIVLSLIAIKLK